MRLLIASRNQRKIDWMREIFQTLPEDLEIVTLEDIGYELRLDESGDTCEVNSVIKAVEPALIYPDMITVSDDGGIFFKDADIGGVHSKRYEGDLTKDALSFINNASNFISTITRECKFKGTSTVAWHNGGKIFFKSFSAESVGDLRVRHINPDDIPDHSDVYTIIERVYRNQTIPFNDMDKMQLMDSTGALELFSQVAWFIKYGILKTDSKGGK